MGIVVHSSTKRQVQNPIYIGVDIGGTRIRAAGYYESGGKIQTVFHGYESSTNKFHNLKSVVEWLKRLPGVGGNFWQDVAGVSFGIAGAFDGHKVKITNNKDFEEIDLEQVREDSGFPYVGGVNDLEATAYGVVAGLNSDEKVTIHLGVAKPGNQAVIAPGTGLGEAIIKDGKEPMASEGGHCDFAPTNETQIKLLRYLQAKYVSAAISNEDVLSGNGLVDILSFLCEKLGYNEPEFWDKKDKSKEELATLIAQNASENKCLTCVEALRIFISVLAQESSNLALKSLATGGVYVAGTALKNLPFIERNQDLFCKRFEQKRKQKDLVSQIPVHVITKEDVNEWGAAYFVSRQIAK